MKKLFLSIALLASLSASAQSKIDTNVIGFTPINSKVISGSVFFPRLVSNNITLEYKCDLFTIENDRIKIIKPDESILIQANYMIEKFGNSELLSKEVKFRKAKIAEYKKLGYAFDGMVTGANGKFMKFVK